MAHKSREPARAVRGKMTKPRDRGEKYVAPQILLPSEARSRLLPRRGPARRGEAHDLIRKLDAAILQELSKRSAARS